MDDVMNLYNGANTDANLESARYTHIVVRLIVFFSSS